MTVQSRAHLDKYRLRYGLKKSAALRVLVVSIVMHVCVD